MNLLILARRTITFRQIERGEVTVLLVPGRDQIQVVKDLAGMADVDMQARSGASQRGPQLSRVFSGQRYIYGYLPDEIRELRQAVKVWLAEDFAPTDCHGFFYVFSPEVIIHGVRENSDEGVLSWRTAQLVFAGEEPAKALINAVTDYVLANPTATLCVAVLNQLELYRNLQNALQPYGITPVPFSTLKPLLGLRPLYRQMDHTLVYLTSGLFGLLMLLGSGAFYFLNWTQRSKIETQIEDTQRSIQNIQLNQSTGHIHEPQQVLDSMAKAFSQQPSAIIDSAASVASQFGELIEVSFRPPEMAAGVQGQSAQQDIMATVTKSKDKLLFDQERRAHALVVMRPWIRSLRRIGTQGDQSQFVVGVQTEQAPMPSTEQLQAAQQPIDDKTIRAIVSSSQSLVSGAVVMGAGSSTATTVAVSPVMGPEKGVSAVVPSVISSSSMAKPGTAAAAGVSVSIIMPKVVSPTRGAGK